MAYLSNKRKLEDGTEETHVVSGSALVGVGDPHSLGMTAAEGALGLGDSVVQQAVPGVYAASDDQPAKKRREGRKDPKKLVRLKRSIQANFESLSKGAKNIVEKTVEYWNRKPHPVGGGDDEDDVLERQQSLATIPLTEAEKSLYDDVQRQKETLLGSLTELAKVRRKYEESGQLVSTTKMPILAGMFYAGGDNEIMTFNGNTIGSDFATAVFKAEIGRHPPTSSNSHRNILFRPSQNVVPDGLVHDQE